MGALIVAGAAIVLLATSSPGQPSVAANELRSPTHDLPSSIATDGRELGSASAPLTLRVYSDFQCPVCARFGNDYLPSLVTDFVVDGRLRIIDEPIAILGNTDPDESVDSAVGAVCAADQGAYWQYHDWLFANQSGENRGAFSRVRLAAIADRAVDDTAAWQACFADRRRAAEVRSRSSSALEAGITSTPTFVLGDQAFVGLPGDYATLKAAIEAALGSSPAPSE